MFIHRQFFLDPHMSRSRRRRRQRRRRGRGHRRRHTGGGRPNVVAVEAAADADVRARICPRVVQRVREDLGGRAQPEASDRAAPLGLVVADELARFAAYVELRVAADTGAVVAAARAEPIPTGSADQALGGLHAIVPARIVLPEKIRVAARLARRADAAVDRGVKGQQACVRHRRRRGRDRGRRWRRWILRHCSC